MEDNILNVDFEKEYYDLRNAIDDINDSLVTLVDEIDEIFGCVSPAPYLIDKFRHDRIFSLIAKDVEDGYERTDSNVYAETLPEWVIQFDKNNYNSLKILKQK